MKETKNSKLRKGVGREEEGEGGKKKQIQSDKVRKDK
jgi:hypothetical protein